MQIIIKKINELYVKIQGEKDILREINEHFSFFVPDFNYMQQYKNGTWDGKIKLFNLKTCLFPIGILIDLLRWLNKSEISLTIDKNLRLIQFNNIDKWCEKTYPQLNFIPHDFQDFAFRQSIKLNKSLILSPTRFAEKV